MRRLLFSLILSLLIIVSHGQTASKTEFTIYSSGLMYSASDMTALRFVVDSLNLRFKSCGLDRTYHSNVQSEFLYVRFTSETNDLKEMITAMQQQVDYYTLVDRFRKYVRATDTVQVIRAGLNDKKEYEYLAGSPGKGYNYFYRDDQNKNKEPVGAWQYEYVTYGTYGNHWWLVCRFYPAQWKSKRIPDKYARLIQYVDCMIDTSAYVYFTRPEKEDNDNDGQPVDNTDIVCRFIDKQMGRKHRKHYRINNEQIDYLTKNLSADIDTRRLIKESLDSHIEYRWPNEDLEKMGQALGFYNEVLTMKRQYRPVGLCSQDTRPRDHAKDIAMLAAQSHQWDIFLRSHLDILNDRFSRRTDGSYAWDQRQTYLKELEELNIDVVDLILGLTLRAQNVANNHYYGSVGRMGRAMAESKHAEAFSQKAIAMIRDNELDDFNRGLVFLLYYSYTSYLSKEESKTRRDALRAISAELPLPLREAITKMPDIE